MTRDFEQFEFNAIVSPVDEAATKEDSIELPAQINGKVREGFLV